MARIHDHPTSLLLVEGNDDFHVIHSLCKKFNVSVRNLENPTGGNFSVVDCKGIDELLMQIPLRFKSNLNFSTLGIIIDADTDLKSRWLSVVKILNELGFITPKEFPLSGLILTSDKLKIGVWIMPNNNLNGMLEDFMSFLISEEDPLLPIVDSTIESIEKLNLNKYSPIHKSKAKIHTWLAWQEVPGIPLGQAITKNYLTTDEENCIQLIEWLNKLFGEHEVQPLT